MVKSLDLRKVLRELKRESAPFLLPPPVDPETVRRTMRAAFGARRVRWADLLPWSMSLNAKSPVGRGQFSSQRIPWRVTIKRLAPYLLDLMSDLTQMQAKGIARSITLGLRSDASDAEVAESLTQYGIEPERAALIARTEMSRARADTSLGRLRPNERVVYVLADDACPKCVKVERRLRKRRLTAKQAEGIIPVHPNCNCSWRVVERRSGREIVRNDASGFAEVRADVLEYSRLVENANPEGCNQHTGPNCAGGTGEMTPYVVAVREISAASPEPKTEPRPLPPGTSRPDLRAQHPEWEPLIAEHREYNRAMRRYRVAQALVELTRPVPDRPVSSGTATERRRQFLRVIGDLESARNAKSFLDTTLSLDHPDGPSILSAGRSEASARYERLTVQARRHLAALDPVDAGKGRRKLDSLLS